MKSTRKMKYQKRIGIFIILFIIVSFLMKHCFNWIERTLYLKTQKPEQNLPITEDFKLVNKEFAKKTAKETIYLTAKRGKTNVYSSKLGGTPYLPPNFEYPHVKSGTNINKPLKLLAQINFSEMPSLEHFPKKGILQFYIGIDDMFGIDFYNLTEQNSFRVVYHPDIIENEDLLQSPPTIKIGVDEGLPFNGEFILEPTIKDMTMNTCDYMFEKKYLEIYNKYIEPNLTDTYDMVDNWRDVLRDSFSDESHNIGGYPFFAQEDPRRDEALQKYNVLLFQLSSQLDEDNVDDEILWGDCGYGNFFIPLEKLEALDFSDIMYTWDCY